MPIVHSTTHRHSFKNLIPVWLFFILAFPGLAWSVSVPKFGIFEQSFNTRGSYSNPYKNMGQASARLTSPTGKTWNLPLFWDGGNAWKIRVSPNETGQWTYVTNASDAGLDNKQGSFDCVTSGNKGGIVPMHGFPYHFQYQNGAQMFWLGDTLWPATKNNSIGLNETSFRRYVDVRSSQGFNVVNVHLDAGPSLFSNYDAEALDLSNWRLAENRIAYMTSHGITPVLFLAWGKRGWNKLPDSAAARDRYVKQVVARYSAYNVVFSVSGEWHVHLLGLGFRPEVNQIGASLMNNDPHDRMITVHPFNLYPGSGSTEEFAGQAWMDLGDFQQYYGNAPLTSEATDTHRDQLHDRLLASRDHAKPVVNAEYGYLFRDVNQDGRTDKPHSHSVTSMRRASWVMSMAGGYFVTGFASTFMGGYRSTARRFNVDLAANNPLEQQLGFLKNFFTSLAWWKLNPADHLVSGAGGYRYCLRERGTTYVVYVSGSNAPTSIGLEGSPRATYRIRKFDPRTNSYSSLANYTGTGPIVLLAPGNAEDWIYLIQKMG